MLVLFHRIPQGFPGIELVAWEADHNADTVKGGFVLVPRGTFKDRQGDALYQPVNGGRLRRGLEGQLCV